MSTIGKFLLIFGLLAMFILFVLSLVLYKKDKRMELAVMGFALAMALAVTGVTVTVQERARARRAESAASGAARAAQSAEAVAALTNQTWFSQPDGTYIHADGTPGGVSQPDAPGGSSGPELPQSAPTPDGSGEPEQNAPVGPVPA